MRARLPERLQAILGPFLGEPRRFLPEQYPEVAAPQGEHQEQGREVQARPSKMGRHRGDCPMPQGSLLLAASQERRLNRRTGT